MKIRTDFVTNSSSSSFLVAYPDELTPALKDAIVQCVMKRFGKVIPPSGEYKSPHPSYISKGEHKLLGEYAEKMQQARENGLQPHLHTTDSDSDYFLEDAFLDEVYKAMTKADPGHFKLIYSDY